MDNENFSEAPLSVAEIRSSKNRNGADWSPRDALIHTLREIDKGVLDPQSMIICMAEGALPNGGIATSFVNATPNPVVAYGLLVDTILKLGRTERLVEV